MNGPEDRRVDYGTQRGSKSYCDHSDCKLISNMIFIELDNLTDEFWLPVMIILILFCTTLQLGNSIP